jgi:hypothetical protein
MLLKAPEELLTIKGNNVIMDADSRKSKLLLELFATKVSGHVG